MNTPPVPQQRSPSFLETHSLVMPQPQGLKVYQEEQEAYATALFEAMTSKPKP